MSDWYKKHFWIPCKVTVYFTLDSVVEMVSGEKKTTNYDPSQIPNEKLGKYFPKKNCPTQIPHHCGSSRYCRIKRKRSERVPGKKNTDKTWKMFFLRGCLACIRQAGRLHPGRFIRVFLQENPSRALKEPVCSLFSPSSSSSAASPFFRVFSSLLWKTHFWQKSSIGPA